MPYIDTYNLRLNNRLQNRVEIAIYVAAEDIKNEIVGTPNHANRLIWANSVQVDAKPMVAKMIAAVCQNATINAQGEAATTDNDLQFVVNGLVDRFATGA